MIFITDDAKVDWWAVHKGKTIGPKPQLIQEMYAVGSKAFYIYKADQFIEFSLKFLELEEQPQVVEEAKEVRQHDKENNEMARYAQILASGISLDEYKNMLASTGTHYANCHKHWNLINFFHHKIPLLMKSQRTL